ncbi:MAG: DUF6807 family protein [Planctomycetota bacterium]
MGNGHIANAEQRKDEDQFRAGRESDWCDQSGVTDGGRVGMTIMPDPRNLRRCCRLVRDFGLMAPNSFGHDGAKSHATVKNGPEFHLGYGVLIHSASPDTKVDLNAPHLDYLHQIQAKKQPPPTEPEL